MSGGVAERVALDPKQRANLEARCALAGVVLYVVDDDRGMPLFIASKWSLTKQMSSVAEVETFLRGIGGPNA